MSRYCRCPGVIELSIPCGRRLPSVSDCEFDHIGQRSLTADDSLDNYRPLCALCHDIKSHGLGGTRRITTAGSDSGRRAKVRRVEASWSDFTRQMAIGVPEKEKLASDAPTRFKRPWPKRPFPKRPKDDQSLYQTGGQIRHLRSLHAGNLRGCVL